MDVLIGVVFGFVVGVTVSFFVARNNRKKLNEALDIDPKISWDKMISDLKARIK